MPIIDVFITFKMKTTGTNPKTGKPEDKAERYAGEDKEGYTIPDWGNLQQYAAEKGSVLNVYTEDEGNCNMRNFLKSLQSRLRIVVIAAHGWTDGRQLRNGTIEAGGGIRINQGQALGTFGLTQAKTDKRGRTYGEYSPIPIIKASRIFFFSCNPGGDFREILRTHLIRGSIAYYTYAGTDSGVWIPTLEQCAYAAATSLIFNQEAQTVKDANDLLSKQHYNISNGDKIMHVFGTR